MPRSSLLLAAALALSPALAVAETPSEGGSKAALREAACAERATEAAQTICLSRDLTRHEAAIEAAYETLERTLSRTRLRKMRASHRLWEGEKEACGADEACLAATLRLRLAILEKRQEQTEGRAEEHNDLSWRAGAIEDGPAPYAWLVFGVPETDARAVTGACVHGSTAGFATLKLTYYQDKHGVPIGETVDVDFMARATRFTRPAEVIDESEIEGISGILVRLDFSDPLWTEIVEGAALAYTIGAAEPRALSLTGSGKAATRFLAMCRARAHHSALAPEHDLATRVKHATCDAAFAPSSDAVAADAPTGSVRVVNATEGYRSVFLLDAGPTPGEAALNLNPGEEGVLEVAAGRRLMLTDGPGNCIEVVVAPAAGEPLRLDTPSPGYDERDD